MRDKGQGQRLGAGRDDRLLEVDGRRRRPSASSTRSWCGEVNCPSPRIVVTLRCLASPARPPVSRLTTPSFHARRLSTSMSGAPKRMPCSLISLVSAMTWAACKSALDGMQPTLRQTPPSVCPRSTRITLLAQVSRPERGRVSARPGTQDEHLRRHAAGRRRGSGSGRRTASRPGSRRGPGLRRGARGARSQRRRRLRHKRGSGTQVGNQMTRGDTVANRHPDGRDGSGHRRRNVHRCLIGLECDERILGGYLGPGTDMNLDHWHVSKVAEVGNRDLDYVVDAACRAVAGRIGRNRGAVTGDPLAPGPEEARPRQAP